MKLLTLLEKLLKATELGEKEIAELVVDGVMVSESAGLSKTME